MSGHHHIALRISDKTYNLPSTVIRHNPIAFKYGAVWIGKPDRAIPGSIVMILNEQCEQKVRPTRLFIIDPDHKNPVAFQAELYAVSLKSPQEKEMIPPFYKELKILSRMKVWFKVSYLDGFRLDEMPYLDKINTHYDQLERKATLLFHPKSVPGYFDVVEEKDEE